MAGFGAINVDLNPGGILTAIFQGIDSLVTTDEEKMKLRQAAVEAERTGQLEDLKVRISAILAEAQSADKWTSRARPVFLYVIYEMIQVAIMGAILSIWWPDHVGQAASSLGQLLNAIPDSMWALFGAGYLGYTGARTWEKNKGVAK